MYYQKPKSMNIRKFAPLVILLSSLFFSSQNLYADSEKKQLKAIKRIAKNNSRFAFDSEDKALEHLKFMKRKQLGHLNRETKFIEEFLSCENLTEWRTDIKLVPDSRDLVHTYLAFD